MGSQLPAPLPGTLASPIVPSPSWQGLLPSCTPGGMGKLGVRVGHTRPDTMAILSAPSWQRWGPSIGQLF